LLDADPLVRCTAVMALRAADASQLAARLAPLLDDPVRAVRIEAARRLAAIAAQLDPARKPAFERALAEYEAVQKTHLDRPESWLNLGNLAAARADAAAAETAYREALKREPRFVPAHVNLADLKREQQREAEAEAVLRAALKALPNAPALHEALGLSLVRQGRKAEALREFAAASKAAPSEPRYAYLHAVALHDAGRVAEALRMLADAAVKSGDRDVLLALATYRSQGGDESGAAAALRALAAVNPDDPALRRR
jgi:tetratricopeptide (TPR) repeat protein